MKNNKDKGSRQKQKGKEAVTKGSSNKAMVRLQEARLRDRLSFVCPSSDLLSTSRSLSPTQAYATRMDGMEKRRRRRDNDRGGSSRLPERLDTV